MGYVREERVKAYGPWQELANAVTMLPLPVYVLMNTSPPPWTLAVVAHSIASITFHIILFAAMRWPHLRIARRARAAMDFDMALIHVAAVVALAIHSSGTFSGALGVTLNLAALTRIWFSRKLPYGAHLESELVQQRYPLMFIITMYEALLVWLNGDVEDACGIAGSFVAAAVLVLLDDKLGGYGHPLGHFALLPGIIVRTRALVLRGTAG